MAGHMHNARPSTGPNNQQKVLEQTIINRIGANSDNLYVQYGLSLVAVTLLSTATTAVPSFFRFGYYKLKKFFEPNYPTITFLITRYKSMGHLNNAGNAIIAWMEHLKEVINDENLIKNANASNKKQITKIRSVATNRGRDYRTGLLHDSENHWLPNQSESFIIDKNIFCEFKTRTLEHKEKGEAQAIEEYTLQIYTDIKGSEGLKYLLKYNDTIVSKYEQRLKSRFENQCHIFEFDSYDEKNDSIKWIANEFSSSRELRHIWFEEKNTFIEAYNNFLFNKEEYDTRGDPYTFSILLYGPPGCGKTSLLKSLVNFDKKERNGFITHLFVVPFSKIKNSDVFSKIMFDKKINGTEIEMNHRIYVFEDFDANIQSNVFNIRKGLASSEFVANNMKQTGMQSPTIEENKKDEIDDQKDSGVTTTAQEKGKEKEKEKEDESKDKSDPKTQKKLKKQNETLDKLKKLFVDDDDEDEKSKSKLHLSDILNILDGLCERTGQRCIWTTNKAPPQKYFDPAFLRPGRMDMIIKLGECTHEGIKYLLEQYFCHSNKFININNSDLNGIDERRFTPAQLKQICKESNNLKNAIEMLREICLESKENDDDNKGGDINIPINKADLNNNNDNNETSDKFNFLPNLPVNSLFRTFSAPMLTKQMQSQLLQNQIHAVKLHSGHWMSPKDEQIVEPPLLHGDTANNNNKKNEQSLQSK